MIPEKPTEFRKPLKDLTAKETDTVTLECELNKPDVPVKWLKDGQELTPDDRVKFSVDQYLHQLIMTDVTLDDTAKYSCVCGDVSTEATVTVEGNIYCIVGRTYISDECPDFHDYRMHLSLKQICVHRLK